MKLSIVSGHFLSFNFFLHLFFCHQGQGRDHVFLRCMGTVPRSVVVRLGRQFERICEQAGVKAFMKDDENLFHISGSLEGLVEFERQVASSRGRGSGAAAVGYSTGVTGLPDKTDRADPGLECVPVDTEKLSAVLRDRPTLLSECSQGVKVRFPALCVEGPPHRRAQTVTKIQSELKRHPSHQPVPQAAAVAREVYPKSYASPHSGDVQPRDEMAAFPVSRTPPSSAVREPFTHETRPSAKHFSPTASQSAATGNSGAAITLMCWRAHRPNVNLEVCLGDITGERVDAIVNPANERLRHYAGVAGAIVAAGGESIIQESNALIRQGGQLEVSEVVATRAGRLPCQHILHAVGPR